MKVTKAGENLEVYINHQVIVSDVNALKNFRDYLEEVAQEFEYEYTKTMHQIILSTN